MDDRLGWFVLGALIGFIVGYIVRGFREIRARKNEDGFVTEQAILRLSLFCVIVISVTAAFLSQRATNNVTEDQKRIARAAYCNQTFLGLTIMALNERTTYAKSQADANVNLQRAQATFFKVLLNPESTEKIRQKATTTYVAALATFLIVSTKASIAQRDNPFPTETQFVDCVGGKGGALPHGKTPKVIP
jgi:cytochrome bd-type quinol oxidase subunit 2